MLSVSRKADYGLLFLSELANSNKEYVSVKGVAKKHQIPVAFLSKIALSLKEMGVVESKEGVGGGYKLCKKPGDILLGSIVEYLDGPVTPFACVGEKGCVCEQTCGHKDVMEEVSRIVAKTLNDYCLADLVQRK